MRPQADILLASDIEAICVWPGNVHSLRAWKEVMKMLLLPEIHFMTDTFNYG